MRIAPSTHGEYFREDIQIPVRHCGETEEVPRWKPVVVYLTSITKIGVSRRKAAISILKTPVRTVVLKVRYAEKSATIKTNHYLKILQVAASHFILEITLSLKFNLSPRISSPKFELDELMQTLTTASYRTVRW